MTRAAIYTRISDDREGRALGVDRQEADCRALAARLGYEIVEIYSDNDISASTRTRALRPDYRRMLADASSRLFEVILSATQGRVTRKPRENEDLIELAERVGTLFVFDKSPSFDLNTADGRMMARILAAADAAEAERIGERTKRKLAERAAAGLPHGGQRPYAWELDRVTIREDEAATIRWGVRQTLAGIPLRTQFRELNERGVTNSRGGAWTHSTYRGVLLTARHAGLMPDGRTPGTWEGIITPEEHRALVRLLSDPERVTTPGRAGKLHLLSGIARCALCGGPLRVGKSSARPPYDAYAVLRCYPSGHIQRRYDHIEAFVLDAVATILRLPNVREQLAPDADEAAEEARRAADAEAIQLGRLIEEAADEYAKEGLSPRALSAYLAPLERQLAEAEKAAEKPVDRSGVLGPMLDADDPGAAFLTADPARQRTVVNMLVEVRVGRGARGNVFNPAGITITRRPGA